MQKIVEFKKKTFWASRLDMNALNEKISSLNKDGWVVKSVVPNSALFGGVISYTLLLELAE